MNIVVIGSGLIGVTTAYLLRRCGHTVRVIDRQKGPALEASFANGALLTPGIAEPWNAPGTWRVLLASIGHPNAAMQLRLRALPGLARWGVTFLRNSNPARFERNATCNLRLALYSIDRMHALRRETGIEYGREARGTLGIFRDESALDQAATAAGRRLSDGLRFRRLSRIEAVQLEPALAPISEQLSGALHYQTDETGDAYRFCVALAEHAQQLGVEFHFRTEVSFLEKRFGRVTAVVSDQGHFVADRYIVAAGSCSAPLLRRVGVNAPVRPVKGYSITFDRHQHESLLSIPVIDHHLHAAIVPLEGAIRVAGIAEFAGYDRTINSNRIHYMQTLIKEVLPRAQFDVSTAKAWCGLRPMSVDGVPLIGFTSVKNLMISTGHGHLGWTMAAGSAQLLTDMVSGIAPSINPTPYDPRRFN